jgi:hypothetical protein
MAKAGGDGGSEIQSKIAKGEPVKANAVEGEDHERGDNGKAAGDMWDQIETCWWPASPVPVTLEVVIDTGGRPSLPPRMLRSQGPAGPSEAEGRGARHPGRGVLFSLPRGAPLFGRKSCRFAFVGRS